MEKEQKMISAVVLTKNEKINIGECIQTLSFCDEIIVVDDNSVDTTKEIAEKHGASVLVHPLENDFGKQRNYGLEQAKGDWIFFVDADERVSKELEYEIRNTIPNASLNGYYVKRCDFLNGKMLQYGETAHVRLLRLVKKGKGVWKGSVHETLQVKGETGVLSSPLLHYPHQTVTEFLDEINFYTDIRAQELYKKGVRAYWYDSVFYPMAKFTQNYIIRKGYKDGLEGMVMALMMSFHSFLVRGKLWQLWDQKTSSH